ERHERWAEHRCEVFGLRLSPLLAVLHLLDLCLHGEPPCESCDIVNVGIPLASGPGAKGLGLGDLRPCMNPSAVPRQAQVITPAGGRGTAPATVALPCGWSVRSCDW